jgi:hypothetical protein
MSHATQQALFDLPCPPPAPTAAAADPARAGMRRWWRLQGHARRAGRPVEPVLVTPHFVGRLDAGRCPVTREALSQRTAQVLPLRGDAAVAAGHLALLGPAAAAALAARPGWTAAWATADRLAAPDGSGRETELGLDGAAWRRLAVLQSFVQPISPAQAAWLPLLVLPPPRLRVIGAAQALQVALTLSLTATGRGRGLVELATRVPDDGTRLALRVFVLTLLARCPHDLAAQPWPARRCALEALWTDPLLQRRWHRLAGRLDDALATRLLRQGRRDGTLSGPWRALDDDAAVDGWELPAAHRPARGAACR